MYSYKFTGNKGIVSTGMKVKVYICLNDTATSFEIDVKLHNSIEAVKWKIYRILYIPPNMQVLRYHDENLENDKTVQYYKIEVSSTIYLEPKGNQHANKSSCTVKI